MILPRDFLFFFGIYKFKPATAECTSCEIEAQIHDKDTLHCTVEQFELPLQC